MDQWIEVTFPEDRDVLIDDALCGKTNKPILVQLGSHVVTLAGDHNYLTPNMPVQVFNTTKQTPMILVFTINETN